eukprot:1091135-Rhodomonas_salina.1
MKMKIRVRAAICLRDCYAMPGTTIAYRIWYYAQPGTELGVQCYAPPGTDWRRALCVAWYQAGGGSVLAAAIAV